MRGISYKWRQELAQTGYHEAMIAYGHTVISRWPVFDRHNLRKHNNRVRAYIFGAECAKEYGLILKHEPSKKA